MFVLRTFGLEEKEVRERLKDIKHELRSSLEGVDVILRTQEDRERALNLLKEFVYSEEDEPIEYVLGKVLREKGLTLSTAESCTAGLLSARIVNVPGSSAYFFGGFIVYSNEMKIRYLKVKEETLKKYGAVSYRTCYEMLEGLKRELNTDCGVAITGIAGPGGTPKKPEGLTYIGIYVKEKITILKRVFNAGRNGNRFLSTQTAMFYLLKMLRRL
ncbi:CinA family protein [Aquifex pyrophilus]